MAGAAKALKACAGTAGQRYAGVGTRDGATRKSASKQAGGEQRSQATLANMRSQDGTKELSLAPLGHGRLAGKGAGR